MQAQRIAPAEPKPSIFEIEASIMDRLQELIDLSVREHLTGTIGYLACCKAMVNERHKMRHEGI